MDYFMKVMFNEMVNNVDTQIFVTKTVKQLLFDGYDDPLLDAAAVIKYLVNISIPFDKFGWFYSVSDLRCFSLDFVLVLDEFTCLLFRDRFQYLHPGRQKREQMGSAA